MLTTRKRLYNFIIIFFISFNFLGCFSYIEKSQFKKDIDYNYVNTKIKENIPKVKVLEVDTNQIIELKAWRPFKNAEHMEDVRVDLNVKKYHIIKHRETAILNTYWEAVIWQNKNKDSLFVGVISPMGDPKGRTLFLSDVIKGKNPIGKPKSSLLYIFNSTLSPTLGNWYLLHNNPLFTDTYKKRSYSIHFFGDFSTILAILSFTNIIEKDSSTKTIGKLSLTSAILFRILNFIESGYLIEYNHYSHMKYK